MKKFEELEQQETTSQESKPKTAEKVRISPKIIAILGGILLIAVVGFVFLFRGTGKSSTDSNTTPNYSYTVTDGSNSKPVEGEADQSDKEKHIYENGEYAEIKTPYGRYKIAVTKAEILPARPGRDAVYQITWETENVDYSSEYNTNGILITPTISFSVSDSDGYILERMVNGWEGDWVNEMTTVAPGKKCVSKYTYKINNPGCEHLTVDLIGMDVLIGQGATFQINVINNVSGDEHSNNDLVNSIIPGVDITQLSTAELTGICSNIAKELEKRNTIDSFDIPNGTWTVGENLNNGLYSIHLKNGQHYAYFNLTLSQVGNFTVRASSESEKGAFSHVWLNSGDVVEITSGPVTLSTGTFAPTFADADEDGISIDLNTLTDDELVELYRNMIQQLSQHSISSMTIPGGVWIIGEDIPAGTYDIKASLGDSHGNFSVLIYSTTSFISSFGDVLSLFGYGNEEETAMNIEMQDGYVLILVDCTATLSTSDENVFFG